MNPGLIIPMLPEESNFDETESLNKNKIILEYFLNDICRIYEVRNS